MPFRESPRLAFGATALISGLVAFVLLYYTTTWNPYAVWLAAWSAVTLGFYAFDKAQAMRGRLRVPKVVLHGLAAIGGYLGGWGGMLFFRHKVQQPDFWLVLVLSTLGHAALVCYWFIK